MNNHEIIQMLYEFINTVTKPTYLNIGTDKFLYNFFYTLGDSDKYLVMGHSFINETSYNMNFNFNETTMYIRIDKLGKLHTLSLTLSVPKNEKSNEIDYKNLPRYMKINNLMNEES